MNKFTPKTPKYTSPPFNPGVRTWCRVKPERHIVDYNYQSGPNANLAKLMAFRTPPNACDMGHNNCGYPVPYSPPVGGERAEGFGFSSDTYGFLFKLLIIAIICYTVYYFLNQKRLQDM